MSKNKEITWKSRLSKLLLLLIYAWYGQSSANQTSPLDTVKLMSFYCTNSFRRLALFFLASQAYSWVYTILLMMLIIAP